MYLEIVKDRLYNPEQRGKEGKESAQFALYNLMLTTVKMFAPIMPFITEEVYQHFFKQHEKAESVHISKWPAFDKTIVNEDAEKAADALQYAVQAARRAKSEKNLSLKEPLKRLTLAAKITQAQFDAIKDDITGATKAEELFFKQICEKSEADFECQIEI
jgi:valyl-tRNA synthetase